METLKKAVFLLLLALLLAGNPAYAINIQSVDSGVWRDPNTWNPQQVPGPVDDAIITTDTHVTREVYCHLTGPDIVVNSLTVEPNAVLLSNQPQDDIGEVLHITAHRITNHGLIRAEGGYSTGGLVALVLDPWFVLDYNTIPVTVVITELAELENFGVIEAGDALVGTYGNIGGEVVVWPRLYFIDFDCDGDPNDILWINPVVSNRVDAVMDGGKARDVGGHIVINALNFTNDGLIKAGNNDCPPSHVAGLGGCVSMYVQRACVYVFDNNQNFHIVYLNAPEVVAFLNTGEIRAGTDYSSTVSQPPGPGTGGSVWVSCEGTWTNSGEILAGDGELGGCITCLNSTWPWTNTETGQIIAGSSSGGVSGGHVCAFGIPKVNRGIIRAGDGNPPGNVIDPMLQELSNNAEVWGENVKLAGDESMIIDLYSLTQKPAIQAEGDLEIILPPGGILEIQGCPNDMNNPPYLASAGGNIVIHANEINISCGLGLSDLFSPTPTVMQGSRFACIRIGPGGATLAEPGEESTYWVDVINTGTKTCYADWQISSDKGWLTNPQQGSDPLGPGESKKIMLSLQIPEAVGLSEYEVVSLHAEVNEPSQPVVEDDNKLFIFSRGYSKVASLGEFAATWLSAPNEPAWNVYYNLNGDSIIDFRDFAEFAMWWLGEEMEP